MLILNSLNGEAYTLTDKYSRQWHMHGKLHKEDGPAYESKVDDFKEWRLNEFEYSEESFHIEI